MKNIPNTPLYCVEVPKDAEDLQIITFFDKNKAIMFVVNEPGYYETGFRPIGKEDLEILGTIDSEEISFDVEPYLEIHRKHFGIKVFKTYEGIVQGTDDKREAFCSLLQSHGIEIKQNTKLLILEKK